VPCIVIAQVTSVYKYIDENGVLHLTNKLQKSITKDKILYQHNYVLPKKNKHIHLGNKPFNNKQYSNEIDDETFIYLQKMLFILDNESKSKKKQNSNYVKNNKYQDLINETAFANNIKPELLNAIVKVESAYNPLAVSHKGAVGLMQLMPGTAKQYGVKDSTDPIENLVGGAKYFRYLLNLFNDDTSLALAAYNSGQNTVIKYGNKIPPYPETQSYVKKILALVNG
jgi:soluble lytic murein transglycosylase-like protein